MAVPFGFWKLLHRILNVGAAMHTRRGETLQPACMSANVGGALQGSTGWIGLEWLKWMRPAQALVLWDAKKSENRYSVWFFSGMIRMSAREWRDVDRETRTRCSLQTVSDQKTIRLVLDGKPMSAGSHGPC